MDTEELKRLAEAANDLDPGEWTAGNNHWVGCVLTKATLLGRDISLCVADCTTLEAAAMQNAAYIAAANPAAVLELIQQRDELLAALKRIKANLMHQRLCGQSAGLLHAAIQAEGDAEEVIAKMEG